MSDAIVYGAGEVGMPTFLSTLCICIVFVPVFLLHGTAKYLFSPLSLSVIVSLLASLALSFTLVPVLFLYLMRGAQRGGGAPAGSAVHAPTRRHAPPPAAGAHVHPLMQRTPGIRERLPALSRGVPQCAGLDAVAGAHRRCWYLPASWSSRCCCSRCSAGTSFRRVDAGQMRLHVRAPPGTRIESTQQYFAQVEAAIRQIVGNEPDQRHPRQHRAALQRHQHRAQRYGDRRADGRRDPDLAAEAARTPTAQLTAMLRRELPQRFPALQFFFQPADIVNQVLNFGQPAPIDIRVTGSDTASTYALAQRLTRQIARVPGVVDAHVFQVPDAPALSVDVDRALATQVGLDAARCREQRAGEHQLQRANGAQLLGRPAATA